LKRVKIKVVYMKRKFSNHWKSSKQPRKQRKFRHNAPLHVRQKLVSATLDKSLRKEFKTRSLPVRKNDEVQVMRGEFKKMKGKVSRVDLKKMKVYVEGIKRKKSSGQEVLIPIDPSNVKIVKLYTDDKKRLKSGRRQSRQSVKGESNMKTIR
jgi:large subunit ribosomal protein L24